MKRLLTIVAFGAAFSLSPAFAGQAPDGTVQAGDLLILDAFSRATLPGSPVGGGYLTIRNLSTQDDRLLSVSAPIGKQVQIHETGRQDGVMSMRPLADGLSIPAGETVRLEPGGYHLMILGLTTPLVEGRSLDMVLHFEKAGDVTVGFDILALNARQGRADTGQTAIKGDAARIDGVLHVDQNGGR